MDFPEAKLQIDTVIKKARIHLYKPIQIAEILYRSRVAKDIELNDLETYRTQSRKWRDIVCKKFLGTTSTSSARFQDNLFDENAVPPEAILALSEKNENGEVEAYIYKAFKDRVSQMSLGLNLVHNSTKEDFQLTDFINSFRRDSGLSRSVDKIFEIVVYAIFSTILDSLDVQIGLKVNNPDDEILTEFSDFTEKILGLTDSVSETFHKPNVHRVGVTNAADRGLDMWANFGLAIQIKHLSLTSEMVDNISSSISADRIVIVCKDCDKDILISVIKQFGQGGKIQAVITESELADWYERALRGLSSEKLGNQVLTRLANEIIAEFPATEAVAFEEWWKERGYNNLQEPYIS